jgi:hypothetical protein
MRKNRTVLTSPAPLKMNAANKVERLMKLYPRTSTEYMKESNGVNKKGRIL